MAVMNASRPASMSIAEASRPRVAIWWQAGGGDLPPRLLASPGLEQLRESLLAKRRSRETLGGFREVGGEVEPARPDLREQRLRPPQAGCRVVEPCRIGLDRGQALDRMALMRAEPDR